MTDHPIRLFATDAAVRRIGEGLLDRSLPKGEWTHEAHLAACAWLTLERHDIALERELPNIIKAYNLSVGGVNDETQGYHETLTQLYIRGVRAFLAGRADGALVGAVNDLLTSSTGRRDWPLQFYSRDRLFSVAARLAWVEPNLAAI